MRRIILLTFLVFLTFKSKCCTCDPELKEKDLVRNSEYAFIGEAISNIYKDEWTKRSHEERGLKMDAIVRVMKVLKGKMVSQEVIVISSESSSCQINLVPWKRYLITGSNKLNKLPPPEFHPPPGFEIDSSYFTTRHQVLRRVD
ncbi:hypothetical protein [Chryseolinea sp. H1M3-3]|uniref:hypothetical protein n=1 Tax=Chryseolinea sp. H1M3-3 TaxID=3034144 RepID=UPI0023EC90A4|nr:hypothetical protein [Chryseolinea sp. H1M3-3]